MKMKIEKTDNNNPKRRKRTKTTRLTRNLIIAVILLAVLVGILGTALVFTDVALRKMSAQMIYMQDSVSVISSNLENLGNDLSAQLEEETSLIEDYSIKLKEIDFGERVYTVDITLVPKEYTESTETSIYFGTTEFTLEKDGFKFFGTATLPIDDTYTGNVTVLLTDGQKRTTEILKYYKGIDVKGNDYISASNKVALSIDKTGVIRAKGDLQAETDGCNLFSFSKVEYVVSINGNNIYTYDLKAEYEKRLKESEAKEKAEKEQEEATETQTQTEEEENSEQLIDQMEKEKYSLEYEVNQKFTNGDQLAIEIYAITAEGYELHYELEHETIAVTTNPDKPEEAATYELTKNQALPRYFVFKDLKGGVYRKSLGN